jgi:sugar transferase (PEP-CTERM/EpsH1 system associated)
LRFTGGFILNEGEIEYLCHKKIGPGVRKKIFVLLSRVPFPIEKGDKLRAFYQIRELGKRHDIVLCALSDQPVHPRAVEVLRPLVHSLHIFRISKWMILKQMTTNLFSDKPFQVAYFYNPAIARKIHRLIARERPDHMYCQLIRTAEYLREMQSDATLDYQDVFSQGLFRRMVIAPWYLKPLLRMEFHRVRQYENQVFDQFTKKTIISHPDRQLIPHPGRDQIRVIPNGVDFGFFRPAPAFKEYDIIFSGNMGYPPNINGASYLVRMIMPFVWQHLPQARVAIAGANPSPAIRALAEDRVMVTGWVDDMRDCYNRSRVFVAPMQIGTGLQNKVLEAMAMGLPCVTSGLANQALGAEDGKEVLVGTDPENYAQHIVSLLTDPEFSRVIAEGGHRYVSRNFQWSSVCSRLEAIITGTGE